MWDETWTDKPTARHTSARRPDTAIEALMETAPGQEPVDSWEDIGPLRDLVAACVDMLPDLERTVIEGLYIEQVPYRKLAERLGRNNKNFVLRARDRGLNMLREFLESDPTIMEKFMSRSQWELEAAVSVEKLVALAVEADPAYFAEEIDEMIGYAYDFHTEWRHAAATRKVMDAGAIAVCWLERHYKKWTPELQVALLVQRQSKYGYRNILKFGLEGVIIRMSDKAARLINQSENFGDESIVDTYMDIVGYAAIADMLARDVFESEFHV